MPEAGDVILAQVQFTDTREIKVRPALVLFSELGNIVVAGITSNTEMEGIPLSVKDGAVRESVIKLNYIFTISREMVRKQLFRLGRAKRETVLVELGKRLEGLRA